MKPLEVVEKICSLFMSGRVYFKQVYIIPSIIKNNSSLLDMYRMTQPFSPRNENLFKKSIYLGK